MPWSDIEKHLSYVPNTNRPIDLWKERLKNFSFSRYDETRNIPSIDGSSKLSPYSRFGLVSVREIYQKALQENGLVYISEIARREFWQHIYYHFPDTRTTEFQEKRRNIAWNNDL
jgi:deoxyribodipyrimidine photo-lyase